MDWALVIVLQVMFQPSLSVLFTVEAEQATYESEFGGTITMACSFKPKVPDPPAVLKLTWYRIDPEQEVYWLENGTERWEKQDKDYKDRARLLTEELQEGWAKLQISNLRISDSGKYQCLVHTADGIDYKMISLSVKASYKDVTKRIEKPSHGDTLLTCQSTGFPESSVAWEDGRQQTLHPDTNVVLMPDQRFQITSQIRVRSAEKNNYTCTFKNGGYSAIFHIPDDIPPAKSNSLIVGLSMGMIMLVAVIALFMYQRRKGIRLCIDRSLSVDSRSRTALTAAYCKEENLGVFVKHYYCNRYNSEEDKRHCDAFGVEELPRRLQNNDSQPVTLQAVLPDPGQLHFLEGPPGSGKTTIAQILVSSWARGPTNGLTASPDLRSFRLLVYVDCSRVKGDLFQEITAQLPHVEKIATEDELRTALTTCGGGGGEALLVLDGYKEGNQRFDESLRSFLDKQEGCRVLVTACPDHCPTLRDRVGAGSRLQLQTQTETH